jgi:hypothetical protein
MLFSGIDGFLMNFTSPAKRQYQCPDYFAEAKKFKKIKRFIFAVQY